MKVYRAYLCADSPCPHDRRFVHRLYFGCVPGTFSDRTGRARGHTQVPTTIDGLPWRVYLWDGGCDAAGVTAAAKIAEYERAQRVNGNELNRNLMNRNDG